MNRQLLASLIGMGIGLTVVAQESAAGSGKERALLVNPEPEAVGEAGYGTVEEAEAEAEVQYDTLHELLRLRIIDARRNGSIYEYVDGPTDVWRDRVSLQRLA